MRLHTDTNIVEKSDNVVESAFEIKATSKAFSILSSSLYSDKVLAVIRELSCNAYDGHVAAGNSDVPFEIKLPTTMDPTFFVKDFGIGLSDFEVRGGWFNKETGENLVLETTDVPDGFKKVGGLYNTYFDSSKSDSNDYIGALGLGSKSPFSYGPSFSVESRHEGVKRLYNAFIGDQGVPQIALLGEEECDDSSGMTISLATKREDSSSFRETAQKVLMYFDPMPKIFGNGKVKPYELAHTAEGSNWRVRKTESAAHMKGAYVVQGQVAYPIDRHALVQHNDADKALNTLALDIDFFVPIGQVEVAASREALSYTPTTITNLLAAIKIASEEMRGVLQKQFDDCKTQWEAQTLFSYLDNNTTTNTMYHVFQDLSRVKKFTYKGKEVEYAVSVNVTKIKDTTIDLIRSSVDYRSITKFKKQQSWTPINPAKKFDFGMRSNLIVLVDDLKSGTAVHKLFIDKYRTKKNVGTGIVKGTVHLLLIKGVTKKQYNKKEVANILKQLGNPPAEYVSALGLKAEKSTTAGGYYKPRKADRALCWTGFPTNKRGTSRATFSRLCWENQDIDLYDTSTTDRFYVPIKRFTVYDLKGIEALSFDAQLKDFKKLSLLPQTAFVYGLNEKQVELARKNKAWKNVFDYSTKAFEERNKADKLLDRVVVDETLEAIGSGMATNIVQQWPLLNAQLRKGEFKNTMNAISMLYEASKTVVDEIQDIRSTASNVGDKTFHSRVAKKSKKLITAFTDMLGTHSMLRLVNWDRVRSQDVDMIIEYANFVADK